MKISNLLENSTPASSTDNTNTSAPKFGRSDKFLEDETVEESTTAGSVASVSTPVGKAQRRGKGSMLKGIKTSSKYPNSTQVRESQLDEVNPQNYDSDEDYYDDVEADDLDLDKFGNGWDIPDEIAVLRNQLRHTTSQYARAQIENKIKRYEDIYYGEDDLEEGSALNRVRDELGDQGYIGTQDDRKHERQKHREYMDRLHQSRMHQQDRHQRSDDAYTDSQVAYWNAKADQYKQGPVHGGLPGTGSDPMLDKAMNMFIDRMNRHQYKSQRDVDPEQLEKISKIKYKDEVDEGNKFLQQHGFGGKFPEPRKPRPDGIMSKSEVLGKDGLVYHWQDPRGRQGATPQGVGEAKKANTKTARQEFGKRPRAELSDKEKEQKKSESDEAWERLMAYAASQKKEKVDEKSVSQAQFRTMAAVAHNPEFAKKVGISQKVGKEFHSADKKQDYKDLPAKVEAANPAQQAAIAIAKKKEKGVAEAGEWTKLPNGNWRNMHTGAQQSTPPNTKKPRRTMGLHASLEQHADDKMKELGNKFKPVDETRVGNRMSDISIGSPKIVHYKGKAVGEVGLDHEASPGNGPYYMKHYLTGKDMVGYESKQQALADLKHLVMQYEGRQGVAEDAEYDDEAGMAETNLHTIARAAQGLIDTIGSNENLPEWAQEKIAKVEGMLVAVWDYLESQEAQGIDPQVDEDWQKTNKRDNTDGMSRKAVKAYRRENPGSKLQTAVTTKPSKLKKGSKAAKRRKSFCARMGGMKGPMKDEKGRPTAKAKALRRWNCESVEQTVQMLESVKYDLAEMKQRLDPKCWKGYKKQGTKVKGGVRVNNCVPVSEAEVSEDKLAQDLYKDLQIFKKGTDKGIGSKAKDKEISSKAKDKEIIAKVTKK